MLHGEELRQAIIKALYKSEELLKIGYCRTWAMDKDNNSVKPEDESACQWCMEGAFIAATVLIYEEETAKQIQQYCVALTQAASEQFSYKLSEANYKNKKGLSAGPTRIHKGSVIPLVNDASNTTQADVIKYVHNAGILARKAIFSE